MRQRRVIFPTEYRHGKYDLYGALSIASTLAVAGLLILMNFAGLVLAALARRR